MTKRILTLTGLLLAFILLIGFRSIVSTVNAGTGGYTADAAIDWVKSQQGKQLDYDNVYPGECVDLINIYAKTLGQGYCYGNAKDYASNNISAWKGWTRIKGATPQKGDILIWTGGEWGHVAIYENSSTTWHQNYNGKKTVQKVSGAYNSIGLKDYWGVIRPDFVTKPADPLPTPVKGATMKDGIYMVRNVGSNMAMNYSYGISNPNPIQLCTWGNEDAKEQHFKFVHEGNGKYRIEIQHKDGGLVNCECKLPVTAGVKLTGRANCNDDTQRFYITLMSDGTYVFRSANNASLVIGAVSSNNFANLTMQNYDANNKLQRWKFDPSAATPTPTFTPTPTNTPVPVPATPVNVKASSSTHNSAVISWNAVSDANGYEVYRSTSSNGTYAYLGWVSGTSKTSTAPKAGTTYYYKVRAFKTVNGTKYFSNYSSIVSATPKPSKPSNIKVSASSPTTVKLTWTVPSSAEYVQVWRTDKANAEQSDYTLIGTYPKTTTSATSKYLTPNKTYYYKLRSYVVNSAGKKVYSPFSSVFSVKPSVTVGKPTGFKVSSTTKNSITLTWNAVSGTNIRYEVWRVADVPGTLVDRMKNTSITDTGLKSKTSYCYRIRAYFYYTDANGNGHRVYGDYTSIIAGTTK